MKRTLFTSLAALAAAAMMCAFSASAAAAEPPAAPTTATATASGQGNAPTPTPTPTPPAAPAPAPKSVRARVLSDCQHGKANDLVHMPPEVAKDAEKAGLVDTSKAACEYAASLEQNKPKPKADSDV